MLVWSLIYSYGQLFVKSLQFSDGFVFLLNVFFDFSLLAHENFVFDFEVFCSTKTNSEFVKLIIELCVVCFEPSDFANIKI